ncbi:alpha/beta hydrolase [Pseudolysobacter antarcticus]|nr:alpha/beta fold hydrolase [Pseudolysobacter antarcticus]
MSKKIKIASYAISIFMLIIGVAVFAAGSYLTAPNPSVIGELPSDLTGESIVIPSRSGSLLHGWYLPGEKGAGAIALLHSLHGSRLSMLSRARLLHDAHYSVLLFDFQANGESPGKHVTFGYLESIDAQAAVDYMRARQPDAKIGVIGMSMGGAAAIMAAPSLPIDALVVEAVYPSLDQAIADRLTMRLGTWSEILIPLLTFQIKPRLGFEPAALRPITHVASLHMPKLFIAGSEDLHTRIDESRQLFAAASEPKEFWSVDGAAHIDLYAYAPKEYADRVLAFLATHLR